MDYEVGQVIYLLSPKTLNILPALVVEEITRKTVDEVQTQFVVEMPDDKRTRVTIDEVNAQIFTDVDKLRSFMIDNATQTIDGLISNAIQNKEIKFDNRTEIFETVNKDTHVQNESESVIIKDEDTNNTISQEEK